MILGLTGGLGCGKSTAAGMFAPHGYQSLDSDAIVRDVVLKDAEVIAALRAKFGQRVLTAGAVDSRQLARRVFADEASLRWLEDLLHPRVFAHWRTRFEAVP